MTETTETAMPTLTVARIPVPATIDAPDAGPFLRDGATSATRCAATTPATTTSTRTAEEMLPAWQDQTDRGQIGFTAERDGEIVGVAKMMVPTRGRARPRSSSTSCPIPERWGEGVEEALLARGRGRGARASGVRSIQTWTLHRPDAPGERLPSPTGCGSIPAEDRQTQFMLAERLHSFEQAERNSVFDLTGSFEVVERMLAEAIDAAGPDYRVVAWTAPTPDEYQDGFAYVDLPHVDGRARPAGSTWTRRHWDAARVERRDARLLAQGLDRLGRLRRSTSRPARSPPTTSWSSPRTTPAPTQQWGTLVLKEHRGRRLGTIVKCANLIRWRELDAGVAAGLDLQRRGEPPHARHQRGDRLRAGVLRGRVEEGPRELTPGLRHPLSQDDGCRGIRWQCGQKWLDRFVNDTRTIGRPHGGTAGRCGRRRSASARSSRTAR